MTSEVMASHVKCAKFTIEIYRHLSTLSNTDATTTDRCLKLLTNKCSTCDAISKSRLSMSSDRYPQRKYVESDDEQRSPDHTSICLYVFCVGLAVSFCSSNA